MTRSDAELIEKVRKWLAAHDASDYYASAILSQCPEDVSRAFVRCADEVSAQSAEIARLREAVVTVADGDYDDAYSAMAIARAALEPKG